MDEKKKLMVIVKKGEINLEFNRSDITEIKQTHDGIVLNLKEGMHLYMTDGYMTMETKQKIITAFDRFKNSNISIDLKNYSVPAQVQAV